MKRALVLIILAGCAPATPKGPTVGDVTEPVTTTTSTPPTTAGTDTSLPPLDTDADPPSPPPDSDGAEIDLSLLDLGAGSGFVVLDNPEMVPAAEATWLDPDDVVLGVAHPTGEAHAFPVSQMSYHHIANTTIAGEPYLVTY